MWLTTCAAIILPCALAGCNHSPSQDILGSFFPAWMLCATLAILLTIAVRQVAIRIGLDVLLPARLIFYLGVAICLTFLLWLIFYGN
ncbi:MAG: hypothetical protein AUJ49_13550 [Desulfovibrionaceae bacterium CG1_02_65_16]|nr:MAG: hypothetical protein AUJ49_13550 [Desulfovibrionaceae bacterium CG1_02_65_16]